MKKTVLMYWPTGGNVEKSARIFAQINSNIELIALSEVQEKDVEKAERLIIGCSTVGSETWEGANGLGPWNAFFKLVEAKDMSGKEVAIFGLGDQVRWPKHFVDGMAIVHEKMLAAGAHINGAWPVADYHFDESEAQVGDVFVGLALDADNESEKSRERIVAWLKLLDA